MGLTVRSKSSRDLEMHSTCILFVVQLLSLLSQHYGYTKCGLYFDFDFKFLFHGKHFISHSFFHNFGKFILVMHYI